jgi:phosphoribosyl 1,2-cyclic phosphodiesterase
MLWQFTVLASGSAGNASLLQAGDFGLLLDLGLGPRQLAARLAAHGASWQRVQAALLTHTHGDHWNERTLAHLVRLRIPLYCHPEHEGMLLSYSHGFMALRKAKLVRPYEAHVDLNLAPGLTCRPLPLRHDSAPTFGFRFEGGADLFGEPCRLGYAADLGCWHADLARALADVDLLALEFNHDEMLERSSGRSERLIARVLGDAGHLSNNQAAELLREILRLSEPGKLRHVVQLHLSRECNRRELAVAAARRVLAEYDDQVQIHTARQETAGPSLGLGGVNGVRKVRVRRMARPRQPVNHVQPLLPGWEE